jgi:hypothetical protein
MSGRHRPSGLLGSRAVRLPLIIIGALSLVGLTMVVLRSVKADAEGCSVNGIKLNVVADPAIAPAISDVATAWMATHPTVEGDCVRVDVTAKPSYEMSASLGTWAGSQIDVAAKPVPTPSDADLPLVWIPESSYWLGRVRAVDREMFDPTATTSIASSPVVLAVPEETARAMENDVTVGIDAALINKLALNPAGAKLKLGLVEPRRDTAGMVGTMMLSDAVVTSQKDLPSWSRSTGFSPTTSSLTPKQAGRRWPPRRSTACPSANRRYWRTTPSARARRSSRCRSPTCRPSTSLTRQGLTSP